MRHGLLHFLGWDCFLLFKEAFLPRLFAFLQLCLRDERAATAWPASFFCPRAGVAAPCKAWSSCTPKGVPWPVMGSQPKVAENAPLLPRLISRNPLVLIDVIEHRVDEAQALFQLRSAER